ncbi:hypothetical protein VM1G_11718 [Cytospora mali]|uniref:Uncharacterized protein n=1 Tax=Cytospora mali TaxID=578113 RepID=A0A194W2X2_CYTMA|nr:hypothetical protein VM1G_11718 [Valsa mali]
MYNMDLISAIGFVSSVLNIVELVTKGIATLPELRDRYRIADLKVSLLIGQLSTLNTALNQVAYVLNDNLDLPQDAQMVRDLTKSLACVEAVIMLVDELGPGPSSVIMETEPEEIPLHWQSLSDPSRKSIDFDLWSLNTTGRQIYAERPWTESPMKDGFDLWDSLIKDDPFQKTNFVVVFTKEDRLTRAKLTRSPITTIFPGMSGDSKDPEYVRRYIVYQLKSMIKRRPAIMYGRLVLFCSAEGIAQSTTDLAEITLDAIEHAAYLQKTFVEGRFEPISRSGRSKWRLY